MTLEQFNAAHDTYLARIEAENGKRFAHVVGQYQENILRNGETDLDVAFVKAVEIAESLPI